MKRVLPASALLLLLACPASAQPQGTVGTYSDVTVEGSILEPTPIPPVADDAEQTGRLTAPEGFAVTVFARDLVNPRMLAFSPDGALYATRRSVGDVVMLKDADGDGEADGAQTVASRPGMHGIAFAGDAVYLATVNDVYTAEVMEDGAFGSLERIINDLPDAGQHPNRTLAMGPDGMLYISVGSTCNACGEPNPENATILRAKPDGGGRTIFASGLRNTIGFDWEPSSGQLWGMDHGIDWLGDEAQVEELNHIRQGRRYGWPYVFGMSELNPQDNPPEGLTLEKWAEMSEEPALGYTPHSAPMQMAFYDGAMFPQDYQGDAFVAMRGSWNRRPPSGYEVVRIDFERGQPVSAEPFLTGFLVQQGDGYGFLGRLSGMAVGPDGALYVGDDSQGIIYRVAYEGSAASAVAASPAPNPILPPPASKIALDMVGAREEAAIRVTSAFEPDAPIPAAHAADGDNASPPVSWETPEGAQSFVLVMDDPDAAEPKPFVHWLAYDIPASTASLREGLPTEPVLPSPPMMKQGKNSMGATGYTGPKPPVEDPAHHYHLQVFALDVASLGLDPGATREEVLQAMQGKVIAKGEIVGVFER
jgi:Raf kinase inhibitor-like YbhB/YbcL family protein